MKLSFIMGTLVCMHFPGKAMKPLPPVPLSDMRVECLTYLDEISKQKKFIEDLCASGQPSLHRSYVATLNGTSALKSIADFWTHLSKNDLQAMAKISRAQREQYIFDWHNLIEKLKQLCPERNGIINDLAIGLESFKSVHNDLIRADAAFNHPRNRYSFSRMAGYFLGTFFIGFAVYVAWRAYEISHLKERHNSHINPELITLMGNNQMAMNKDIPAAQHRAENI